MQTIDVLVVFGVNGDLAERKLIPALYALYFEGKLPEKFAILGVSRTSLTDAAIRAKFARTTQETLPALFKPEIWRQFEEKISYFSGDVSVFGTFERLRRRLDEISARLADAASFATNWTFYFAISPRLYPTTLAFLERSGLATETASARRRLVVEKPFGVDLKSARELDAAARLGFDENRIFRVDHYLGKDAVDNIFALRFANSIFEPLWNRRYVDSIQITALESATIGRRGAFYETTGVLRDMFQSHLAQLLAITAMEPPVRFDARSIRDEKAKVLRSVRIPTQESARLDLALGQYVGYRAEPGVAPDSRVPTFAATRLWIDNWRWKDVPFFLRAGKGASCRTTTVEIQFKEPPRVVFSTLKENVDVNATRCSFPNWAANRLTIQIQPAEGIRLSFLCKIPGTEAELSENELAFAFDKASADAYRRLLLDAINGDTTLFARNDEIESAWEIVDPFQRVVDDRDSPPPLATYRRGENGPNAANVWIRERGKTWRDVCPLLPTRRDGESSGPQTNDE